MTANIEIHYADDWAALYVDGWLETVGNSNVAEEKALALLGVVTVHDAAFMRGQTQRAGAAKNLTEVTEYRAARDERNRTAAALRADAADLIRRANELEGHHTT